VVLVDLVAQDVNMSSARQVKKAQKAMADKTVLFGKLPDKCTGCGKDYDKKNREHVTTWSVTVYAQSERVNLYCPECWINVKAYLEDEAGGFFNE
jgi:hypothetical protein